MMRNDEYSHVQEYIRNELGTLLQRFDMSKEALLQRLGSIVHTELTDVVEVKDGKLTVKDTEKMPEGALGALKSITQKSGMSNELSVTLHDPKGAINEAAKLQKLYDELGANINAENVHIYLPDNGRDDPAHADKKRINGNEIKTEGGDDER